MKIILSRKGFDSSEGRVASPILPSGGLCWLPIPTRHHGIRYGEIVCGDTNLGPIVSDLTRGRLTPNDRAHLDPDLRLASTPRERGWRPLFGQTGAAQGHLSRQGVAEGDLFLFYAWFRKAVPIDGRYQYVDGAPDLHVVFGWLQIGQIISSTDAGRAPRWARYHPHFNRPLSYANDCVYVARSRAEIPGRRLDLAGAGVFESSQPRLCLTAPGRSRSVWQLPSWFCPTGRKSALSYHGGPQRWNPQGDQVLLDCVGRGQEFVLDCEHYPEATSWLADILELSRQASCCGK
jgi:hypothetical protein